MDDDYWKRQLEEMERLARLVDPLREFKSLQSPLLQANEELAALCRDPLEDFRAQVKALADPLQQVPAWLKDEHDQDALAKQIRAVAGALKPFEDQVNVAHLRDPLGEQVKALLEPFSGAQAWLKAFQSEEDERLRRWSTTFEDIARQLRGLPDEARAHLAVLMDQGWCLDPEMPHTWGRDLAAAFHEGEEQQAEQWLIDYFESRLEEIEQTLVARHPTRRAIIADAFQAHREGRYSLSIPALLAQADGVIHDRHPQRQLFSRNRDVNLVEVLSKLPEEDMRAIFVAAFYVDISLTRRTKLLPPGFHGLNRHAVLHGIDPNYGTEINSLRAVSILNLASYLVSEEVDGPAN
ncbi:hypothetical protein QFW77_14640 [Luteimonas sp. RD2P54]|uniref:Uncharacterized protein n=1 Tax=Luteimonas endophytica TaxID=3042023 RepID=A0ABT6JBK4_9GAMM|nr:hypothetical protein [Luteimonas endophytica]MDH5824216.1 hypothetical protein [Luteimonas endophytica]